MMQYNLEDLINKITCADCLDVLRDLPDKCIDLVLTDPPYLLEPHGGQKSPLAHRVAKVRDNVDFMANDYDFYAVSNELVRLSNNIVMFCSNAQISRTMTFFEQTGLKTNLCVWDKLNPPPLGFNKMINNLEYIVVARGKGAYYNNDLPIEKKFMSFRYATPTNKEHPATKPLELFADLINLFSKPNDIVLDCFSGSGTTAVACHNLKRRFICVEKAPEYHLASIKRLEDVQRQQVLF